MTQGDRASKGAGSGATRGTPETGRAPASAGPSIRRAEDASRRGAARAALLIDLLLVAIVFVVYWPSLSAPFVRLDDHQYVVDNPLVRRPTWEGLAQASSEVLRPSTVDGYYQPITMASLMLDGLLSARAFGESAPDASPDPFVFHLTNVLLHAIGALLVMRFYRACGGGFIAAGLLAALFALHPVQVESVAWVSQRKTLLATCLAMGALLCYLRHGRTGGAGALGSSAFLFLLAGLAKPTVLPLAIVLPLLDWWPQQRRLGRPWRIKMPFLAIAAGLGMIAWRSQAASGASLVLPGAPGVADEPPASMIGTVCHSLLQYLGNMVWPEVLSPYRPLPAAGDLPGAGVQVAAALMAAAAIGLPLATGRWRSLGAGAAGFLILIAPALGAVRFDETCTADRFLYLPLVFALLPICGVARALDDVRRGAAAVVALQLSLAAAAAAAGIACRRQQVIWTDSTRLWSHVAAVAPDLARAQYELACALVNRGEYERAATHAERAVARNACRCEYQIVLGQALVGLGSGEAALEALDRCRLLSPNAEQSAWIEQFTAEAALIAGQPDATVADRAARAVAGGVPDAVSCARLGDAALRIARRPDRATHYYQLALERGGEDPTWRWNLGTALHAAGRPADALLEYERVLRHHAERGVRPTAAMLSAVESVRSAIGGAARPAIDGAATQPR